MAKITAALVKELRQRTGLGMMECKKALSSVGGDVDKAIDEMRKSGQAKADKKLGRIAAEGVVAIKVADDYACAELVEVNSETDFAARDGNFLGYVNNVINIAFTQKATDVSVLMVGDIEQDRLALIQKIGENINVRRVHHIDSEVVGGYVHSNNRIAVLVGLKGGEVALARDIAMHIAAVNPQVITKEEMPVELIEKETSIYRAQAEQTKKDASIIEKMISGRVNKFLAENSLVEQNFVKNPDMKIKELLQQANATITSFVRYEVGEGIEKSVVDFAAEVKAQSGL